MTRAPTTLHEHFRADPRGADSFGKWIEDRIWELLQSRYGYVQVYHASRKEWRTIHEDRAYKLIQYGAAYANHPNRGSGWRAVLYDGTIIKEWAAAGEAATDRASKAADQVGG